jgi:hypothetical protein
MQTMPGLIGKDASPEESRELEIMFRNFTNITRSLEHLPNGIRATTFSLDPEIMDVITSHVVGMIARVEEKRDPMVRIQSPTLDIFFEKAELIETNIEITDQGIVVTQTSNDPDMIAALKNHAEEVSDMTLRGMHAVHERMMRTGQGHRHED